MDPLRTLVDDALQQIPIDFGGGCSGGKAYVMAWLIRRFRLKTTLDIGVYRGRSLFPQALAHREFTDGVVYGVDPWSPEQAREEDHHQLREAIDQFIDQTDWQALYESVVELNINLKCETHCRLIRKTSADALDYFNENSIYFDLIHIDGNHDTKAVISDISKYLPRLKKGGFLVMDDVSWESVKPALLLLQHDMTPLLQVVTPPLDDYAIYYHDKGWFRPTIFRFLLRKKNRA